jgi:hypothetical protein
VRCTTPTGMEDDDEMGAALEYEHPSLLHIPRRFMGVFVPGAKVVARVSNGQVELVAGH